MEKGKKERRRVSLERPFSGDYINYRENFLLKGVVAGFDRVPTLLPIFLFCFCFCFCFCYVLFCFILFIYIFLGRMRRWCSRMPSTSLTAVVAHNAVCSCSLILPSTSLVWPSLPFPSLPLPALSSLFSLQMIAIERNKDKEEKIKKPWIYVVKRRLLLTALQGLEFSKFCDNFIMLKVFITARGEERRGEGRGVRGENMLIF